MTIKVFIAYSHKDTNLREELEKGLAVLEQQGVIRVWHNDKIVPGSEWNAEIQQKLDEADIIVFLVSPYLLASEYLNNNELPRAMERREKGEAKVIPIILRPCDWKNTPFGQLQALPQGGQAVTSSSWNNQDEAFLNVAEGIRRVCQENLYVNQTICSTDRRYNGELVSIELVCYNRFADAQNPTICLWLSIAFGEVTEIFNYENRSGCIRFGLKRGRLCLSLQGGNMPLIQRDLKEETQREWCAVRTTGDPNSPVWIFETGSQSTVLRGLLEEQKLGTLNFGESRSCRVEAIFNVEIIPNDLQIIDQYGVWETNSNSLDIEVKKATFFKQVVKPKLENYLNRLVLKYDCNSPIIS